MESQPICINCKHYKGDGRCKAFTFIPKNIWRGQNYHKKKHKEQENEILFEPKPRVDLIKTLNKEADRIAGV